MGEGAAAGALAPSLGEEHAAFCFVTFIPNLTCFPLTLREGTKEREYSRHFPVGQLNLDKSKIYAKCMHIV